MNSLTHRFIRLATRAARRYIVGSDQSWVFKPPEPDWHPSTLKSTSLYLHIPFCRNECPYCPYTKFPFDDALLEPFTEAMLSEVDWWADKTGPADITSIYIGGGTPTLALESISRVLSKVRERFNLTGDICIETNPADVTDATVQQMRNMGISQVSLGVQSFNSEKLDLIGRRYEPSTAEHALQLLTRSNFASVNSDIMFALPGQTIQDVISDLTQAEQLGVSQITTYPLFTFPYSSVGEYLRLKNVRMPNIRLRREQYRAISDWCRQHDFERVSVWGFKRGGVPRYSSVTRDGYIGLGPGAGSHLPDGFVLNSFHLESWIDSASGGKSAIALRMPFAGEMAGWWWLYWRFYDTRIPLDHLDDALGADAAKARGLLKTLERLGLAVRCGGCFELTCEGAFWIHLLQNHFALNYVNTLWTQARRTPWPGEICI